MASNFQKREQLPNWDVNDFEWTLHKIWKYDWLQIVRYENKLLYITFFDNIGNSVDWVSLRDAGSHNSESNWQNKALRLKALWTGAFVKEC